eukprot:gene26543-35210_t
MNSEKEQFLFAFLLDINSDINSTPKETLNYQFSCFFATLKTNSDLGHAEKQAGISRNPETMHSSMFRLPLNILMMMIGTKLTDKAGTGRVQSARRNACVRFLISITGRSGRSKMGHTGIPTISTVGFGDIRLETRTERILNTFYLLAGLCVFSAALCVYNEIGDEIEKVRRQEHLLGRVVDLEQLTFLSECEANNRPVTKFDFVIEMLLQTGKINRERDLVPLLERFAENKDPEGDGDGNGDDVRSVRDVRHLISKHIDEIAVRRNELENDRQVLLNIQSSLPFKYVTMIIGSVSSLLSRLNSVRAAAERSFSTHGLAIPTHSPRKQSQASPPRAVLTLSDAQDRMERGSDSTEGAAANALDDADSVSDDGRRLI